MDALNFRYTQHQVARGSRPDAVVGTRAYLLKNGSRLRLTYQVRLLTFLASERGTSVVIRAPKTSTLSSDLRAFVKHHRRWVKIERV
jgi:hypothetical protein